MPAPRPTCPRRHSQHTVKNGRIHNKKPKYQCQNCKKQFIEKPTNKVISQETIELIDRLLLEKIPLAGIARAAKVSATWLQNYVNDKYAHVPQQINVSAKLNGKLTLECDEAWSFVDNQGNKQLIWLAMDRKTRVLWEFTLVIAVNKEPEDYGTICHLFIVNLLFFTQIFWYPTRMLSQGNVTEQLAKRVVRLITLSALIILCANEFLV